MTRFQQEVSGALGDFWKNRAAKEVEEAMAKAASDAEIEPDGAIKWLSNGRYLMDDFCEKLEYGGYDFSREATASKRDAENRKFMEAYKANVNDTPEHLDEMRAAFGEGTVVVDILSGRRYAL